MKMNKLILMSFLVLILNEYEAQKIYSVNYESRADVKVFVVDYESRADLLVYKVKYESRAGNNDGKWFFVDYESRADKKIFFVDYESRCDLKIFFVKLFGVLLSICLNIKLKLFAYDCM